MGRGANVIPRTRDQSSSNAKNSGLSVLANGATMAGQREEGGKIRAMIEKATNSTASEIDTRLLKAIKSLVRHSDADLRFAALTLMDLMRRDHSQVRYLSLLLIDELFMRSKLFRVLIVENMDKLLTLSVGFRKNLPLPAPPAVASILRSKAIEFLEKWNSSFGIHYKQLRLGFDYLKNSLRFQFPNLQENAARLQQERVEREKRSKDILLKKFEGLKESFSSIKEEMQSNVDEIEECLDIVHAREDSTRHDIINEDEEFEELRSYELRQIRLDSLKEGERVPESSDNKVVYDALRELYKLLVSKHLVSLQEWMSVLIRVELTDNRFRDCILKEFIDIRNRLLMVKKKCEDSGCSILINVNEEEPNEDFWEQGKVEPIEKSSSVMPSSQRKDLLVESTSEVMNNSCIKQSDKNTDRNRPQVSEGGESSSSPLRSKLLAEAPVKKWGSSLDIWGSNGSILANQRGLELESHWGRVDYDAVVPADKIVELKLQMTLYEEEQPEIQPCRAPLSKGGLCNRRDLKVCPFHGPILPRDNEGKPLDQNFSVDEPAPDLQPDLVERLAKQAVKNVRERDKEAAKKKETDKKAKLAKIRQHNAAVLQNAALASTSRSAAMGEDDDHSTQSERNKKQTLSSMLRKKVKPRDRIAKKLLTTQARDATVRQLTMDEEASYREAFPNQW